MPSPETLLAFAVASLVLIAVPGPAVLFVIGRSLAHGWRGGLLSVIGNGLGGIPLVIAVAIGVGAIVAQSIVLFMIVKLLGAAYLVHLGIQAIRHRGDPPVGGDGGDPADPGAVTAAATRAPARMLRQGFVVGVTNPKSIVFFVAVLPQFVDFRAGGIPLQIIVLGVLFLAIGIVSDSLWALAAGGAQAWFARSPRRRSAVQATGGALMIALGGVLALTGLER
ncbi:MAG: LysE family translocator [Microbacteriaceae bacterium]|nr:LysE family translocator [Microbacteriaceae bacterium]